MQITIRLENKVYNYGCLQDPGYNFKEIKIIEEKGKMKPLIQCSISEIEHNLNANFSKKVFDINVDNLFYDVKLQKLQNTMFKCIYKFFNDDYSYNAVDLLIDNSLSTKQTYLKIFRQLVTKENLKFKNAQTICKSAGAKNEKQKLCSDFEHAKNIFLTKSCYEKNNEVSAILYKDCFFDAIVTFYKTTFSYEGFKKIMKAIQVRFKRKLAQKFPNCFTEKQTFYLQSHDYCGSISDNEETILATIFKVYCN